MAHCLGASISHHSYLVLTGAYKSMPRTQIPRVSSLSSNHSPKTFVQSTPFPSHHHHQYHLPNTNPQTIKMKAAIISALVAVAMASPHYGHPTNATTSAVETTLTLTTSVFTTYCPEATTLTQGTKTYTIVEPTTLVITDCPCTYTSVATSPVATYPVETLPTAVPTTYSVPVAPVPVPTSGSPVPSSNGTVPSVTSPAQPPSFTGAAGKVGVPAVAALAMAAFML
ncbi:hypothetical protein BDZ85DRAFT_260885 [Elsinoe ampelina]|uniref:Cell wall protein SED1 n=1 Tax=Elsinoe ampelina TaxID=302913 RepID=A0A6A6GFJ4_9PEZI|nr:hypothetical protein BDZ85DRAFT_260885 [Elsinoe ampelina]